MGCRGCQYHEGDGQDEGGPRWPVFRSRLSSQLCDLREMAGPLWTSDPTPTSWKWESYSPTGWPSGLEHTALGTQWALSGSCMWILHPSQAWGVGSLPARLHGGGVDTPGIRFYLRVP